MPISPHSWHSTFLARSTNSATRIGPYHPGHVDEAAHGGVVQRVVDHVADKLAVDLQQIDLEDLAGIRTTKPGPEVVERHPGTDRADLFDEIAASPMLVTAAVSVISRQIRWQTALPASSNASMACRWNAPIAHRLS